MMKAGVNNLIKFIKMSAYNQVGVGC